MQEKWSRITIRAQNFSKNDRWDLFFVNSLHTRGVYENANAKLKRKNPLSTEKRPLNPLHFETKGVNNNLPEPSIDQDCRLTFSRSLNVWIASWVHTKLIVGRDEQDGRCVALDPGVRTFLSYYSPTDGVGKIGYQDVTARTSSQHLGVLISWRDKFKQRNTPRYTHLAYRLTAAAARAMRQMSNLVKNCTAKPFASCCVASPPSLYPHSRPVR